MADKRLKLIAMDKEDLQVISAHCQDGVLKLPDMTWLPGEKRFVLTLNRFVWEKDASGNSEAERRKSVLHFERVNKVSSIGIDRKDGDQVLSLLAVLFEEKDAPGGTVQLMFAGEAAIRLEVECIEAQLADMKASWAAAATPRHEEGS